MNPVDFEGVTAESGGLGVLTSGFRALFSPTSRALGRASSVPWLDWNESKKQKAPALRGNLLEINVVRCPTLHLDYEYDYEYEYEYGYEYGYEY